MTQITFAEAEYNLKKRKTRREKFLEQMDALLPWQRMEKKIRRYYPNADCGCQPYVLSIMLRVHCRPLFYNLSDPAREDALYESESMRRFAGLTITGALPDESTLLNFRHLLEKCKPGKKLFGEINAYLSAHGLSLKEGAIVDASIIAARTSTKNKQGKRAPEMHPTKKGNEWHFGMKIHIGVDESLGLLQCLTTTAANVQDIVEVDKLLHGEEKCIGGDAGYIGSEKRKEHASRKVEWLIAERLGKHKKLPLESDERQIEKLKAQVGAKVEHAFMFIKRMLAYNKVRYRGLEKNQNRLFLLSGFTRRIKMKTVLLA